MTARSWRRTLSLAVPLLLVVLVWPLQFGGQFGWLATTGNSMAPLLHEGELVLLRRTNNPQVGDVIAYRSPEINRTVLHRVIETTAGEFVTKGDNNDFVDGFKPTRTEVLGTMIFHVPRVGQFLIGFTTPLGIASLVAFVVGAMLLLRARRTPGPNDDESDSPSSVSPAASSLASPLSEARVRTREWWHGTTSNSESVKEVARTGLTLGACVLVIVGVISWLASSTDSEVRAYVYNNTGRFEYQAEAGGPSVVYPDGFAHTGDPVFLALARKVHFRFEFRSDASSKDVSGSGSLRALITDQDGWHHTIELAKLPEFSGPSATLEGDLDLGELQQHLASVQALTLVNRPQHNVAIVANLTVRTRFGETVNDEVFAPSVLFRLDQKQLTLSENGANGAANSLTPGQGATVERTITTPANLSAFGFGLPVVTVRILAVFGLAAIALGFVWLRPSGYRARRASAPTRTESNREPPDPGATEVRPAPEPDEATRIARRYGPLLVPLAPENFYVDSSVEPVESIEALVAIATRSNALILCTQLEHTHIYQVNVEATLYRYTTSLTADSPCGQPDPPLATDRAPTKATKARSAEPATSTKTAAKKTGAKKAAAKKAPAKKATTSERTAPAKKAAGAKTPTRAERNPPTRAASGDRSGTAPETAADATDETR